MMVNDVIFNNHSLSKYFIIKDVRNSLLPEFINASIKLAGKPGEHFVRSDMASRKISIDVEIIANSFEEANLLIRRNTMILYTNKPEFLQIGNRMYKAILDGSTDMSNIHYDRSLTLNFIAFDPIAYGSKRVTPFTSGQLLNNAGTHSTRAYITFTATSDTAMIALNGGGQYAFVEINNIQAGQRVTVDFEKEEVYAGSREVYIDPMGDYFEIPPGNFSLKTSEVSNATISYYDRWL